MRLIYKFVIFSFQTNFGADKDNVILAYGNGCLHAVSSIDGDILWKKELAENRLGNLIKLFYRAFDLNF